MTPQSSNVEKEKIKELVDKYKDVLRNRREDEFSEDDVKTKFINPLLEALEWDVRGLDQVKFEQTTLTGRTDFGLRIKPEGKPVLFIEAKSLDEKLDGYRKIRGEKQTYPEQAIDDAWSMKVDWVVLTNFKKLRLYYSHVKKPKDGLQFELKFKDFLSEEGIKKLNSLTKEAVKSGSLQKYEVRRTREAVNTEFINDLYSMRKTLTGAISKNNDISKEELRESVQRILDRLVVIRVAEDREILHRESLHKMIEAWEATSIDPSVRTLMRDLKNLFRDFDSVYNSKLFEEHMCESLEIDNNTVKEIINMLYNYNFDLINADVLGGMYEDYIGHILEEKEEGVDVEEDYQRRKKSGIYYTPSFVVDFLVNHTAGESIRRSSGPEEVSEINVLDPACGSGSFLIKTFDYLKNYYENYNQESQKKGMESGKLGDYDMVTNINKKILNENLYGVDLDEQAAEIASVNLMLKGMKKNEKLPLILGDNIKVGNSLIPEPIEEVEEFFDNPDERKPMLWKKEFSEIFQDGGFDVVIGNPPYFTIRKSGTRGETKYYYEYLKESKTWKNQFRSDSDIYYYFVIQGLKLLREKGHFGFIIENYWLDNDYADKLRKFILDNAKVRMIIHFGDVKIFPEADNDTCLLILQKEPNKELRESNEVKIVRTKQSMETNRDLVNHISNNLEESDYSDKFIDVFEVKQNKLGTGKWILSKKKSILDSLRKDGERIVPLANVKKRYANSGEFEDISNDTLSSGVCITGGGHRPGRKELFTVVSEDSDEESLGIIKEEMNEYYRILNKTNSKTYKIPKELLVPFVHNSEIKRYNVKDEGRFLIYPRHTDEKEDDLLEKVFSPYKKELKNRHGVENGSVKYDWFKFGEYRNPELFENHQKKIYAPYRATEVNFALSNTKYHGTSDISIIALKNETEISLEYILGLLNSKLIDFWYKEAGKMKGGHLELFPNPLSRIPIRSIDFSNEEEKKIHDKIVRKVENIITLKKQEEWISKTFKNLLKNYDLKNEEPLSYFYDPRDQSKLEKFEINLAETWKIDGEEMGIINEYKVDLKEDSILISVRYKDESDYKKVLDLHFDNDTLKELFFLALKRNEGNKHYRSEKPVFETTMEDLTVPKSTETKLIDENVKDFKKLMDVLKKNFEKKVSEKWENSPITKLNLTRIEYAIEEANENINEIVYDLYELTEEEIETIESYN